MAGPTTVRSICLTPNGAVPQPGIASGRRRRRLLPALGLALVLAASMSFCVPAVLRPTPPRRALAATPGLRSGDSGQDVTWAQLRLAELGCFRGAATGYFGPVTRAAVESYQRRAGLAVSGVLGPQTARRLLETTWQVRAGKGDTLEAIARRHSLSLTELLRANPQIVNPDRIYVGQLIVIPGTAGILKIAGAGAAPAAVPASGGSLSPVPAQPDPGQGKAQGGTATDEKDSAQYVGSQAIVPGVSVVLTFNDGPDPDVLPRILETLRRNSCRAVFFFCGEQMEEHPELVRSVFAQGHSVQSHGWRHESLSSLAETRISAELDATSQLIATLTGKSPAWFRPPEGVLNEAILMSARRTGQRVIFWQNIGALPDSPSTVGRLDRYLSSRTVIMLPGGDPRTADYLQALLDRWRAAGVKLLEPEDLELMPLVW